VQRDGPTHILTNEKPHASLARALLAAAPHASLAFITFTPWTTLEEVRTTLSEAQRWGLPPRGRWLYSTLELDSDAPITALARRDGGILVADWEDAALRYATSVVGTFREGQQAWRFQDPRVADFHAILVRVCAAVEREFPGRVFDGDALYACIRDPKIRAGVPRHSCAVTTCGRCDRGFRASFVV